MNNNTSAQEGIWARLKEPIEDFIHPYEDDDDYDCRSIGNKIMWLAIILWILAMVIIWFANMDKTLIGVVSFGSIETATSFPKIATYLFNACSVVLIAYFAYGIVTYMKPADVILSTAVIIILEVSAYMFLATVTATMLVALVLAAVIVAVLGAVTVIIIFLMCAYLGISMTLLPVVALIVLGTGLGLSLVLIAPIAIAFGVLCFVFRVGEKRNFLSILVSIVLTIGLAWPALTAFYNFQNILPSRYGVEARNMLFQKLHNNPDEVLKYQISGDGFYKEFIQTGENANLTASAHGNSAATIISDMGWKLSFYDGDRYYYERDLTYSGGDHKPDNFLAATDGDDVFTLDELNKVYARTVYASLGDDVAALLNDDVTIIYGKDKIYYSDNHGNSYVDRKTTWYRDYTALTDTERMAAVYDILQRQSVDDGETFTAAEVGWVAYAQASGFLLTYLEENRTAYFARQSDGILSIYAMDENHTQKSLGEFERNYDGIGTGYFVLDHYLCLINGISIIKTSLLTEDIHQGQHSFDLEFLKPDYHLIAYNYAKIDGVVWETIAASNGEFTTILDHDMHDLELTARGDLEQDKELLGIFMTKDRIHIIYKESPDSFLSKTLSFFKGLVAEHYNFVKRDFIIR